MSVDLTQYLNSKKYWTGALLFLGFIVIAILNCRTIYHWPINHDVGWFLYIAGEALSGKKLYTDIIEVNPPLIVYAFVALKYFSQLTGIRDLVVFQYAVFFIALISIFLSYRILSFDIKNSNRIYIPSLCFLLLYLFTTRNGLMFGQREQLTVMLCLPYIFMTALRCRDVQFTKKISVITGVMAGLGIAMKPFFIPVWLGMEIYGVYYQSYLSLKRLEHLALLSVFIIYALCVLIFVPAYIQLAYKFMDIYRGYYATNLTVLLTDHSTIIALLVVIGNAVIPRSPELKHIRGLLSVALVMFLLAVFLQDKGWDYHWICVDVISYILFGTIMIDGSIKLDRIAGKTLFMKTTAVIIIAVSITFSLKDYYSVRKQWQAMADAPYFLFDFVGLVNKYIPHGTISSLSPTVHAVWPLINYTGIKWGSRYNNMWLIPGLFHESGVSPKTFTNRPLNTVSATEREFIHNVSEDLKVNQPGLLIVPEGAPDPGMRGFNYIAYFSRDRRFRKVFKTYKYVGDMDIYKIYVKKTGVK